MRRDESHQRDRQEIKGWKVGKMRRAEVTGEVDWKQTTEYEKR